VINTDIAYIAGLFDGEGCISMRKHIEGKRIPRLCVQISISYLPILEKYQAVFGGHIHHAKKFVNKPLHSWQIGSFNEQLVFLEAILPFLQEKRTQADSAITYLRERISHTDRSHLPESVYELAKHTSLFLSKEKLL